MHCDHADSFFTFFEISCQGGVAILSLSSCDLCLKFMTSISIIIIISIINQNMCSL